jgi:NAD(P)-dependent dehydrogenase (short-subunit alcohol dehydrogenase family)
MPTRRHGLLDRPNRADSFADRPVNLAERPRVALVTGANRGIGLEVCRQLAKLNLQVVLTGRDVHAAESAAANLQEQGLSVVSAVVDITDQESIRTCVCDVKDRVGDVDVLVNNAAVLLAESERLLNTTIETFHETFETNVWGALMLCQALVPSMVKRRYGRVVNVSSGAGQLSSMSTYAPAYSISKAALNAITIQLAAATKGTGVLVNSVDPGWVRTRMGGPSAPRSVEQGADTIVWAATLGANGPTGRFFSDKREVDW